MRIAWSTSALLLSLPLLACSTVSPLDTDGSTSVGEDDTASTPADNVTATGAPASSEDSDITSPTGESTLPQTDTGGTTMGVGDTTEATSTTINTTAESTLDPSTTGVSDTTAADDTSTGTTEEPAPGCLDGALNGDETDIDCGGSCPACDDGLVCSEAADCASEVCTAELCVAPTCDDAVQNQDETDIDCGGAACDKCLDGESCVDSGDCQGGVCDGGVCAAPSCDDNAQNGDETDVDCGGAVCDPCADGDSCELADDCVSGVCTDTACVAATCDDGVKNKNETDIDCGGPDCAPCTVPNLILNEVDYDNVGDDVAEFIEIYNNTGAPVSLVGVHVVLINGSNNQSYNPNVDLTAQVVLMQGQYLVVGSAGVVAAPGSIKVQIANDVIQNGAPDGVALVDTVNMKLLDALSYEGSITNATVTGLGAGINLVEGTAFAGADSNTVQRSLARSPSGKDTNDAAADWKLSPTPTPGAANTF